MDTALFNNGHAGSGKSHRSEVTSDSRNVRGLDADTLKSAIGTTLFYNSCRYIIYVISQNTQFERDNKALSGGYHTICRSSEKAGQWNNIDVEGPITH